jgi:penicillin-binding protein 2
MLDVTVSGTPMIARIDGIDICAKTGTAQNPHGKNHSFLWLLHQKKTQELLLQIVVENAGFGATWAAPIGSLMMEKYLNDTISAKRLPEVEAHLKSGPYPVAIKQWYVKQDSIKLGQAGQTNRCG